MLVLTAGHEDVLVDLLVTGCFQLFRVVPVGHEDGGFLAWSASSQELSHACPTGAARGVPSRWVINRKDGQACCRLLGVLSKEVLVPTRFGNKEHLIQVWLPKVNACRKLVRRRSGSLQGLESGRSRATAQQQSR